MLLLDSAGYLVAGGGRGFSMYPCQPAGMSSHLTNELNIHARTIYRFRHCSDIAVPYFPNDIHIINDHVPKL